MDALSCCVDEIVVALAPDRLETAVAAAPGIPLTVVAGGVTRQQSVFNALAAVSDSSGYVLVHDAARALVPVDVVRRVVAALNDGATCVVPVLTPADSLREELPDGANRAIDRSAVRQVQTPQGFTVAALRRGHASADSDLATDDATLVEATGEPVTLVAGDPLAFKITRPADLLLAEALLLSRGAGL